MIRRLYLAIRDRRIRRRSEDVRLATWWALLGADVRAEKAATARIVCNVNRAADEADARTEELS